ncbi:MAG: PEGA domain-containing protein [Candidatus Paceibacterota bacterium]
MTKRTRTVLFILMVLVFAVIAPSIIMYSQGYRFDIKKMKFLETGGIYIKTTPSDAIVTIDNDYKNRTSGFSKDVLIQNLLPENHNIKIEKENYYSWEKTLEVKEKKVTEAKYIILFPDEMPFTSIDNDVKNFYPFPDNNRILLLTVSNELLSYDSEKKETQKILSKTQTPYNIYDISFSATGKRALIKTSTGLHYLLNTETSTISLIKSMSSKTQNVVFDSNNEGSFFYQSNNLIYRINADKQATPRLFKRDTVSAFAINGNDVYSFENGLLYKDNILLNTNETLSKEPLEIKDKTYELVAMENEIFLIENKTIVYLFNKETKIFDKKIEAKTELKYTPFYERILFAADNELWLLLLKETETPFFSKAYSVVFISRFSQNIGDIKWLNGDYFVYTLNDKINISEIDNRDHINSFELPQSGISKIFFNGNTKKLFLLDEEELIVSENKLLP